MKKLGMNVLLAVGQGSARESQLLVMTLDERAEERSSRSR